MAISYDFYLKRNSGTIKYFKWNIKIEKVAGINEYKWTLRDNTKQGWKTPSGDPVDVDTSVLWNTNSKNYIEVYLDSNVIYTRRTGVASDTTLYGKLTDSPLPSTIKVVVHYGATNNYMITGVSSNLSSGYSTEISHSLSGSTPNTINPSGGSSSGSQFVWNGTANVFWG